MSITYGVNLAKSWGERRSSGTILMKAYTTHTEQSEVFLSYKHADQATAWGLAKDLDSKGKTGIHRCSRPHTSTGPDGLGRRIGDRYLQGQTR